MSRAISRMNGTGFGLCPPDADVTEALRRPVLDRLRKLGAMSVAALTSEKVGFYGIPFNPGEIAFLLESARRDGLLAKLVDDARPDGRLITQPEWGLTRHGREKVVVLQAPVLGRGSRVTGTAAKGVPLAAALGVFALVRRLASPLAIAGLAALVGIYGTGLALLWIGTRGASPEKVADGWKRLKRDNPTLNRSISASSALIRSACWSFAAILAATGVSALDRRRLAVQVLAVGIFVLAGVRVWRPWRRCARADREHRAEPGGRTSVG